jgi:hypothetical protein
MPGPDGSGWSEPKHNLKMTRFRKSRQIHGQQLALILKREWRPEGPVEDCWTLSETPLKCLSMNYVTGKMGVIAASKVPALILTQMELIRMKMKRVRRPVKE